MTTQEDGSVDPIGVVGASKMVESTANEVGKSIGSLVHELLSPSARVWGGELGEAAARGRDRRAQRRVLEKGVQKVRGREGSAAPRVVNEVLDAAGLSDDEVMAEYLSGLLAASVSPSGKDDRAVVWTSVLSRMSAAQIRAHYLLYREWATGLRDAVALNLGVSTGRRAARMHVSLETFASVLSSIDEHAEVNALLSHTIPGLAREGLIDDAYEFGPLDDDDSRGLPWSVDLMVSPSAAGLELYCWAMGDGNVQPFEFVYRAEAFDTDPPLPRLDPVFQDLGEFAPKRTDTAGDTAASESRV